MAEKGKQKKLSPFSDEFNEKDDSSTFESEVEAPYDSDVVIESSKKPYASQSAFVDIHSMWPDIPRGTFNMIPTAEHETSTLEAKPVIDGSMRQSTVIHRDFGVAPALQGFQASQPRRPRATPAYRSSNTFKPTLPDVEPKYEINHDHQEQHQSSSFQTENHTKKEKHTKKKKHTKKEKHTKKKKHTKHKASERSGSSKRQKRKTSEMNESDVVVAEIPINTEWPISPVFGSSTPPEDLEPRRNLRVKEAYKSMAEPVTSEEIEELEESITREVRIWVGYEIWQEREQKDKRAPSTSKRVQNKPTEPIYKKVTSTLKGAHHLHSFIIDPFNTSQNEFKTLGMIEVDRYVTDLSLYLTDPDPPKELSWLVTERTAKRAGRFYNIDTENEWNDFIQIIQDLIPTHFVNLLLKMEDPSRLRQAQLDIEAQEASVRAYKKRKIDKSASRARDEIELPVPGSANERSILVDQIISQHRKGDNSICYDPENNNNYFRVTSEKARMWADIMIQDHRSGRFDVSLKIPPKTTAFRFHPNGISPLDEVRKTKARESQPDPIPVLAPLAAAAAPISTATTSHLEANHISDTDERLFMTLYCGTFEDFLSFARIKPSDTETRQKLENQAFDHWTDLRANAVEGFGVGTLVKENFPPATARKLVSGAERFGIRVRESIRKGFFQPIQI